MSRRTRGLTLSLILAVVVLFGITLSSITGQLAITPTEVLGSLAIILGWHTRVVAVLLAGFALVSAALFHNNFADQTQMVMFLKNVSIAGALLILAANGAGAFSLDARKGKSSNGFSR